jgi:peptide/nickel transport system permease protein
LIREYEKEAKMGENPLAAPPNLHRMKNHFPFISIAIIVLFAFNGIFGKYFLPGDPFKTVLANKYIPPFFLSGGSIQHILGTDYLGRDVLSRLMLGGQISLIVSVVAILVGAFVGITLGLFSGYFGGILDGLIMRFSDAMIAFPSVLMAMLIGIGLGPGFTSVIIAIAFSIWPRFTKIIRGQILSMKQSNFIAQLLVMGASDFRILFFHLLPNQMNIIIVLMIQDVGMAILTEATLSYLGLSIQPPNPSWGGLVADGNNTFYISWWASIFPAFAIVLTVVAFNFAGEWLRKWLDPIEKAKKHE